MPTLLMNHLCRLAIAGALTAAAPADAQIAPSRAATEQSASPIAATDVALRPGRVVLLREASVLVQTTGVLRRDDRNRWVFHIELPDRSDQPLQLILLPCATLEEMTRIAESIDNSELAFEATGEVFVFRNRNYFLPTYAPHVVAAREPLPTDDQPAAPSAEADEPTNDAGEDDSIESIMQRLEQKSGPLVRSSAGMTDNQPREIVTPETSTLREGMMLTDRRGRLTRGSNGSWVFVFDADAEGLADPPVTVLPCLLLERMIDVARRHSNAAPMLLSGRVFEYHSRRYVLPTLYRIPQTRTPIVP